MTVGAAVDDDGELTCEGRLVETPRDEPAHVVLGERLEREAVAASLALQLVVNRTDRIVGENRVDGTVGGEHEQARRSLSPREEGEQVGRGRIAPVEIFERDDEQALLRERLERLRELAHHATRR